MYILIVDSDESIRKALKIGLTRSGWIIDDAPAAMVCSTDLINQHQYNVIIIDFDIEETCVLDIIRQKKQQNHKLIIVSMTRKSISDFFSDDDANFVNACYQKPLHLNMLKKAIDLELKKLDL